MLSRKDYIDYINRYRHVAVYVFCTLVALGMVVLVVANGHFRFASTQSESLGDTAGINSTEIVGPVMSESLPVRLKVPAANINTTFEPPLGLDEHGALAVPDGYEKVGWYKYGPTPGELGPAVIVGHVDSYEGPAVFFSLGQAKEGDKIYVEREDGSTAVFEITGYERIEQSEFPTTRVYGNINYAGLRLITCTGTYSHTAERYSHNLIVYAKLVGEE